ncbi:uncharacterized protein LOC122668891 [Telopea speciosissima]|uniref:uncharacterized protein LOC122668891 n=1 Tax=Telopea speciosissima TaxID=54955 RepID=UPI001CC3A40F|nr:uncharacterized protein LOC122668891 [Telopea speciosissima]XP_043721392.1 uncharacterized protein LOC122668891 [Telopea speciosissima]XP_043721393.1 uncharacterized protein LOC122668891 [Telopea speciosissima]
MTEIRSWRSFRFYVLLSSICLQLISGLADDPANSKNVKKAEGHSSSSGSTGLRVVIICLGIVAVVAFSVFLFKLWQKKKREEQHARLLRLFEEDDELELELGLRD